MSEFDLESYFAERQSAINAALDGLLPEPQRADDPGRLREGMRLPPSKTA